METWDIYDINRKLTGRTMNRGDAIAPGDFHLVVHIAIINSQGEMLIQQRQPFKEGWPNLWDITVGGSALTGETSQQAIKREVLEEIGLEIDMTDIRPYFTINFEGGFDDIYILYKDVDISKLKLQKEEVQAVKWAGPEDATLMLETGSFIPYHEGFIDLIFELKGKYGAHR
jgi:isopentenyldiphosphate isomerase